MAAAHGTPQHVDTEILRSGEEMADINRDYRDDTNLSIPESECCVAVNSYAKKFSDIPILLKIKINHLQIQIRILP